MLRIECAAEGVHTKDSDAPWPPIKSPLVQLKVSITKPIGWITSSVADVAFAPSWLPPRTIDIEISIGACSKIYSTVVPSD